MMMVSGAANARRSKTRGESWPRAACAASIWRRRVGEADRRPGFPKKRRAFRIWSCSAARRRDAQMATQLAALTRAVRDAAEHHASELTKPGPQIDALLDRMSAVDAAALGIQEYRGACTYLGIVEHADYAIAAFVLAPHATIPLHDHPHMTVLSRVVRGSLRVTSFDVGADGKARRSISLMTTKCRDHLYWNSSFYGCCIALCGS